MKKLLKDNLSRDEFEDGLKKYLMKDKCYRASAKPNKFAQSWSNFEYTCNENSGFNKYISQKH